MFQIENISYLMGLWLIPIMAGIYYLYLRKRLKDLQKLGVDQSIEKLTAHISSKVRNAKAILLIGSLLAGVIALSNPQWGLTNEEVESKSSDVIIALDISNSMLCKDVAPSRLEQAKRITSNVIQALKGERIGLIVFAGEAYIQMPLTLDYAAAKLFLRNANPNQASTQGTAIDRVFSRALQVFDENDANHKALIIISDGEDHEEKSVDAAASALNKGLISYTIGVGTEEGGFIPVFENGFEAYKKDSEGNPIKTQFDPSFLKDVANAGGGKFFQKQSIDDIASSIKKEIDLLDKKLISTTSFKDYNSYFQLFAFLVFLFLIVEYLLNEDKRQSLI